jgi:hypothetical protein
LTTTGKGLSVDFRHGRLRSALVAAEVALSIILSICSGLVMRSLLALQHVNLGFNPSQVVFADISWPERQYDTAQQKNAVLRKVLDRLTQFPGVRAATEQEHGLYLLHRGLFSNYESGVASRNALLSK